MWSAAKGDKTLQKIKMTLSFIHFPRQMKTCSSSPFHALNFKITYENTEHFGVSRET